MLDSFIIEFCFSSASYSIIASVSTKNLKPASYLAWPSGRPPPIHHPLSPPSSSILPGLLNGLHPFTTPSLLLHPTWPPGWPPPIHHPLSSPPPPWPVGWPPPIPHPSLFLLLLHPTWPAGWPPPIHRTRSPPPSAVPGASVRHVRTR